MQLIEDILVLLRQPELRRFNNSIDNLVCKHQELTQTNLPGFIYMGINYRHSDAPKGRIDFHSLAPPLYEDMEYHLADRSASGVDLQIIKQTLMALLVGCTDLQDLRDALPECLIRTVGGSQLTSLDRSRQPGWNMDPEGRAYRQYLKHLPKIEFLVASRLIF